MKIPRVIRAPQLCVLCVQLNYPVHLVLVNDIMTQMNGEYF